jgi:hypothetical protein
MCDVDTRTGEAFCPFVRTDFQGGLVTRFDDMDPRICGPSGSIRPLRLSYMPAST